jgi:flagellar basal body-associated protein FliL
MKKQETTVSNKSMKKRILIIIFIIVSIIFFLKSYNIIKNVNIFNEHRQYLKNPAENWKIEDWMTLNYIKRHFNINLQEKLWDKYFVWDMKITLKAYCKKKKIDCGEFIISLEKK